MAPSKMKAVATTGDGGITLADVDVPCPGPGEMLVRVIAAAQNPADWKSVKYFPRKGNIVGCDFAGVVEELGPDAPANLKVGDRVAGLVHGSAYQNGAFAEYVVALSGLAIHLPVSWSFAEGAQLGVAGFTACLCLYYMLGLPTPSLEKISKGSNEPIDNSDVQGSNKEPPNVLIWGGATAVGQYATQLARLSGARVITTCSPRNADHLRSLGASTILDYHTPSTPADIRALTHNTLKYAVDCIAEGETRSQIYDALGDASLAGENENKPVVAHIMPYRDEDGATLRKDVENKWVLGYRMFGKAITVPVNVPTDPAHKHFATTVAAPLLSALLAFGNGKGTDGGNAPNDARLLQPNPIRLMPHGLASVKEGFEYMMSGKVSAEKITYIIADTPGL